VAAESQRRKPAKRNRIDDKGNNFCGELAWRRIIFAKKK
jgi:hypothetical protein